MLAVSFLYSTVILGLNLYDWSQFKPPVLWRETQSYSPEETAAGKTYLQTILNKTLTQEEFEKAISPLLEQSRWGFLCDDPTLYLIHGSIGTPQNSEPKWAYSIPLGNAKTMAQSLQISIKADLDTGNTERAAEKASLILGIGNRVSQPHTLTSVLIGLALTNIGVSCLEENPAIPITPSLEKELKQIINNPTPLLKMGYEEEFKTQKLALSTGSKEENWRGANPEGKPTLTSLLTNPSHLKKFEKEWWKMYENEPKDFDAFLKSQAMKSLLRTGPFQAIWVRLATPTPPSKEAKSLQNTLQIRAKKILERSPAKPQTP